MAIPPTMLCFWFFWVSLLVEELSKGLPCFGCFFYKVNLFFLLFEGHDQVVQLLFPVISLFLYVSCGLVHLLGCVVLDFLHHVQVLQNLILLLIGCEFEQFRDHLLFIFNILPQTVNLSLQPIENIGKFFRFLHHFANNIFHILVLVHAPHLQLCIIEVLDSQDTWEGVLNHLEVRDCFSSQGLLSEWYLLRLVSSVDILRFVVFFHLAISVFQLYAHPRALFPFTF